MTDQTQTIADNLARIHERIAKAADRSGRSSSSVKLVAVSKYVDAATTAALLQAGCKELGESRPQQLCSKAEDVALSEAHWHLIGHLQRNKIRAVLPHVELIHSIDSLKLLQAVNRIAGELNITANVLLEVNCSGDAEKHGMSEEQLFEIMPKLSELNSVKACGLMTMAARVGGLATAARNFSDLRELLRRVTDESPPDIHLNELSMGMSHDFEVAIEEGATIVRIGSLLFGK